MIAALHLEGIRGRADKLDFLFAQAALFIILIQPLQDTELAAGFEPVGVVMTRQRVAIEVNTLQQSVAEMTQTSRYYNDVTREMLDVFCIFYI